MQLDHARRRAHTAHYIAQDPWDVTVLSGGTSSSVEGRVAPVGGRSAPIATLMPQGVLTGETEQVKYPYVLVLPWDADRISKNAVLKGVHRASGIEIHFVCLYARQTAHKWEVILDARDD